MTLLFLGSVVLLGACSPSTAPVGAVRTATPSTAATTAGATVPPPTSSAPTTTATPAVGAKVHDATALKSALIVLEDLPSGWQIEPDGGGDGAAFVTSTDAGCAAYLAFVNAPKAPGSRADAMVSFSGGQDGPFVSEGIDTLASTDAVATLQKNLAAAADTCRTVTLTIPGQGSSPMTLTKVSAPQVGDHPLATRLTARGGDLDGLEVTQFSAGVDDTLVSLSFLGAYNDQVEDASQAAVAKAAEVLGVRGAGASV